MGLGEGGGVGLGDGLGEGEKGLFFAHGEVPIFQPRCVPAVVEGHQHGPFPLLSDAQALLQFFVPCKVETLVR